jgi:predicted RNase H-like nuclease (RuvC/YqgF family)
MKIFEITVQVLKSHAEEKLESANQEIDAEKKKAASEIARLQAALKKYELKCGMLERSLQAKTRENEELTAICDELINKVGPE